MEFLGHLFVGRPSAVFVVASFFLGGFLLLRAIPFGRNRRPRSLLWATIPWGLYGVWEWLVLVLSPEANIRVDLLVIYPLLLVFTAWGLINSLRKKM
jgi:RsiW-degrading membrane proteinase PrsW (M82 family)